MQSNFSGTLTVRGVDIDPQAALGASQAADDYGGNSCIIIVAVDRALDSRQLARVAKRAVFAMGKVGSDFAPTSGDYAIAVTTVPTGMPPGGVASAGVASGPVPESHLGQLFTAATEATVEALLNSLFLATTTIGYQGHVKHAVPLDFVVGACQPIGRRECLGAGEVASP